MRIAYESWSPGAEAVDMVRAAEAICREYARQGYDLTLRQIYYQFVARDWFPDERRWRWTGSRWVRDESGTKNADPNYKWLGDIVNKARLSGMLDWSYIVDRTRRIVSNSHWADSHAIMRDTARWFAVDKWSDQPRRVEVWVEKEALAGIVGQVAEELDVAWFSCRGYVSQSAQWEAAQRHLAHIQDGQAVTVLHLGDHDPSGIDMTRDIRQRLRNFLAQDWLNDHAADIAPGSESASVAEIFDHMSDHVGGLEPITIERIALNMDQIQEYNPPPNPTKLTDSRAGTYVAEHGHESWELDALEPSVLADLIRGRVLELRDEERYEAREAHEDEHRRVLDAAVRRWAAVTDMLRGPR